MPSKVFISYRRDDAAGHAGRVHDRLEREFGADLLFMDVDAIPLGVNFTKVLRDEVARCDVLLALIGPNWLNVRDKQDHRRLDNPADFLRIEIATALQRNIPVIPILLDGARMPEPDELPKDLEELSVRNGIDIRHASFQADMDKLIRGLKGTPGAERASPPVASVEAEGPIKADAKPVLGAEGQSKSEAGVRIARPLNRLKSAVRQVRWGWIAAAIAVGVMTIAYLGVNTFSIPVWWRGSPADISDPSASRSANVEAEAKRRADEAAKAESDRKRAEVEAKRRADEEAAQREPALSVAPGSAQSFRDRLADGQPCPLCPEMVVAPAGTFTMGSPPTEEGRNAGETQIPVEIPRPFAVGKFAVTFDQWDACLVDGGCKEYRASDLGWGRGSRPVTNVNWADANAYAEWLSRKTGKTYRLLSEAEWEYVTRAGTTTPFWWGSSITPGQANYNGHYAYRDGQIGEYRAKTVPVDTFQSNPWGLFNVHGNVWGWTADCWNDSNQGNPGNGSARSTGDCGLRVIRGGSWINTPQNLRAALRNKGYSTLRSDIFGFRLARTLNP
jgi:formylglycine-generating enzyme required for sulfatase activity